MIEPAKRTRLEADGWKVGTVAEFLNLTAEEAALIEMKLALSDTLRMRREQQMSQAELAAKLDTSPQQVAIAETGDSSISLEWLIRAMLAVGATPKEIGAAIASVEA